MQIMWKNDSTVTVQKMTVQKMTVQKMWQYSDSTNVTVQYKCDSTDVWQYKCTNVTVQMWQYSDSTKNDSTMTVL